MAERRFTLEVQHAFAALSGDYNPAHVDPVAARRSLCGQCVAHGMHLVRWALLGHVHTLSGTFVLRSENPPENLAHPVQ